MDKRSFVAQRILETKIAVKTASVSRRAFARGLALHDRCQLQPSRFTSFRIQE